MFIVIQREVIRNKAGYTAISRVRLGSNAQKLTKKFHEKKWGTDGPTDRRTDGPTDGPTDRPTDTPSYRDARTHLKMLMLGQREPLTT